MLSKGFVQDGKTHNNLNNKQFRTCSGSPIIYTKFRKVRGIYYPVVKPHRCCSSSSRKSGKRGGKGRHCCIVYSRTYGREVYGNIDIWPDDSKKLMKIYEDVTSLIPEEECGCEDDVSMDEGTVTDCFTDHTDVNNVDSRENPFLPGGDLSREADDILARAKIVRDTFILNLDQTDGVHVSPERARSLQCGTPNHRDEEQTQTVVNETVTPEKAKTAESSSPNADTRPRENGQIDTDDSLSPGSVKMELIPDCKDRKKHKKCCTIM